jgi:geranylgeranyl pyrophosphate synthase
MPDAIDERIQEALSSLGIEPNTPAVDIVGVLIEALTTLKLQMDDLDDRFEEHRGRLNPHSSGDD